MLIRRRPSGLNSTSVLILEFVVTTSFVFLALLKYACGTASSRKIRRLGSKGAARSLTYRETMHYAGRAGS